MQGHIITLFDFPPPIRKAIYTTNAIETVNSVIRKFTKNRKIYPNVELAVKLIYIAIHEAAKRWTRRIHHWKQTLNTSLSCMKTDCRTSPSKQCALMA